VLLLQAGVDTTWADKGISQRMQTAKLPEDDKGTHLIAVFL